jgi:hypothetical protein
VVEGSILTIMAIASIVKKGFIKNLIITIQNHQSVHVKLVNLENLHKRFLNLKILTLFLNLFQKNAAVFQTVIAPNAMTSMAGEFKIMYLHQAVQFQEI